MDKSFLKKILGQIYLKGITFSGVETTEEIQKNCHSVAVILLILAVPTWTTTATRTFL